MSRRLARGMSVCVPRLATAIGCLKNRKGARSAVVRDRSSCKNLGWWFFFFSSRRRHTRLQGDWSSDVCSSDLGKLQVGEDVPEALACDLSSEKTAQQTIKDGIAHCESVRDYVSRDLLQKILDDTEEHIDYLETQLDLIDKVGIQNYLQSQMDEES